VPHHGSGARTPFIKVAGTLVGDPTACAAALTSIISSRLSNLRLILCLRDDLRTTHVAQLQHGLLRLNASAIPTHWMRTMHPAVTAPAAALADRLVAEAFIAISTLYSPPDRVALSLQTARLPIRDGGLGLASFTTSASAAFVASFIATCPTCCMKRF
jgi:hypothetical protein